MRLPILLVVSLTGKMKIPLSPYVPENLVSRDGLDQPGKVANPARAGKMNISLSALLFARVSENLVSRDGFGRSFLSLVDEVEFCVLAI